MNKKYVLGLDLGPSSIGWAAIEINEAGIPTGLIKIEDKENEYYTINSRIFPSGVENLGQGQNEKTRNKKRRESRGLRKVLRRRRARKLKLIDLLRKNNILPHTDKEIEELQKTDPYKLRREALLEKIDLYQIGRVLLHFTKRRGFKSNRKDFKKESDLGDVNKARTEFKKILNGKTPGEFWYEYRKINSKELIRNRRSQYRWIAERNQYEEELRKIWEIQKREYPDILTPELYKNINEILFSQIPYEISNRKKREITGYCSLIKGKIRCDYSNRLAQEFRLLQKLNDIEVRREGKKLDLAKNKIAELYNKLMVSKEVKFSDVRKILDLRETDKINFEYEGNESLIGNEIDCQLTKRGLFDEKYWLKLNDETKELIWQKYLDYYSNESISLEDTVEHIQKLSGYVFKKPESICNISVPSKTIKYSFEALKRIVPHMRNGFDLYEAINKEGFTNKYRTLKKLPLPNKANGYHISNPNVKVVLFELRKLLNRLIDKFGKPQKIIIEFTRDIKASKDVRQKILRQQSERRKLKKRLKEEIISLPNWTYGNEVPKWAIEKYILWHEQKFLCPYSGETISQEQIFTRDIEIDHIIPYSMSLDNSLNNKVICFAKENQDKGQRTPFDWIGQDEIRWSKMLGVIDHFNPQRKKRGKISAVKSSMDLKELASENKDKWQRFFMTSEQINEIYWQPRFSPETGYIAREIRDYLKRLYFYKIADQKILTTKGGITYELRKWWDLNRILGNGDEKERDDLRHHAIDAMVIASTTPKIIKNITNEIQKAWPQSKPSEVNVERPWNGFNDDITLAIQKTNISHRVQRKVKGQLHKETHYWKENNGINKGKYITRKFLNENFSLNFAEHICDEAIKEIVLRRLKEYNNDSKKAFLEPLYLFDKNGNKTQIKKVRVWKESTTMKNIRGNAWVEPGSNHHIEIFEYTEGKNAGKRGFCVITTYDAVNRIKKGEPIINRNHGKEIKYLFSLSINEMFMLEVDSNKCQLHRIQKIDQNGNIILRPHNYGGKLSDSDKPPLIQRRTANSIKGFKVTVDFFGRIRRAND